MTFERGIWKESARNFWVNKWVVLTAAAILTAVSVFQDYTHSTSSSGILAELAWLPVAIAAHATVLNGSIGFYGMDRSRQKTVFRPFLWRSLVLSLVGVIPAIAIAISFVGHSKETIFILLFVTIYAAIQSLILAKWGTMLPACVAGGDKSFKAAGGRGSKTFVYVLGRFWGCNALLLTICFAGLIFAYTAISIFLKKAVPDAGNFVLDQALQVFFIFVLAFNIVMLATVLSRAYLIAEAEIKKVPAVASAS